MIIALVPEGTTQATKVMTSAGFDLCTPDRIKFRASSKAWLSLQINTEAAPPSLCKVYCCVAALAVKNQLAASAGKAIKAWRLIDRSQFGFSSTIESAAVRLHIQTETLPQFQILRGHSLRLAVLLDPSDQWRVVRTSWPARAHSNSAAILGTPVLSTLAAHSAKAGLRKPKPLACATQATQLA